MQRVATSSCFGSSRPSRPFLVARNACSRPTRCRAVARSACRISAELREDPFRNVNTALNTFFRRYDVVSTGMGAMIVTGYCVYVHGQDPFTALGITFSSTVVALVANELLFNDAKQ